MKLLRILIIPSLILIYICPQNSYAATLENHTHVHHHGMAQHEKHRQWLIHIVDQYAPAQLANQMKKDMTTHQRLVTEWRETADFQKKRQTHQQKHQEFHKKTSEQIRAIRKQVELGKLSPIEGHQKIAGLFAKKDKFHHHETMKQLKTAIRNNDRNAIVSALEQIDKHIQASNQRLSKKLGKNQKQLNR